MGGQALQVEEELIPSVPERGTLLSIGVFDGVHRGHQYLLGYVRRQALVRDLHSGVVTFRCHPQQVLSPQTTIPYLTTVEDKIRLLKGLGLDLVVPLSFTPELAQLSARQFVALVQKRLKMQGLVIGPDFALGRGREGNVFFLSALGKEMGFTVEAVPPFLWKGEVASSTTIRQALARGDLEKVEELLGRSFSLRGEVVRGQGRGKSLGFPTANLAVNSDQALPADGIYATYAYLGHQALSSVTNIGFSPTFGGKERRIEVFLIDFQGELYGQQLRLEMIARLRGEQRFSSAEELVAQMARDVEGAREVLQRRTGNQ